MSKLGNSVVDFSERLRRTTNSTQAWEMYNREIQRLGCSSAFYGVLSAPVARSIADEWIYFCSHERAFVERYEAAGHGYHDWRVHHCQKNVSSRRWKTPDLLDTLTPRQMKFEEESWDFGLYEGIVIPFHNGPGQPWGGVGIAAKDVAEKSFNQILDVHQDELEQVSLMFHSFVCDAGMLAAQVNLTGREKECLLWIAAGLRVKEVAFRLSIEEVTVRAHLREARCKLKAMTLPHAVCKAVTLGIVHL